MDSKIALKNLNSKSADNREKIASLNAKELIKCHMRIFKQL